MSVLSTVLIATAALALGGGGGYAMRVRLARTRQNSAEIRAEKIIAEAKQKEQELLLDAKQKEQQLLLEAKQKALAFIDDAKKEEQERRTELKQQRARLEERETLFDKKIIEFEDKKTKLQETAEQVKATKEKIDALKENTVKELERVAQLTKTQAEEELMRKVAEQSAHDLQGRIIKLEKTNTETFDEKARTILIDALQRCATNLAAETTSTAIPLPSDEMKGRIIGKDGRNIKAIEKLTGCELIIDETPDMLLISGFSPIRRRVCQLALEKMITDGVIQPQRIEQSIEDAKKELAIDIKKAGEEALYKLGFTGIDPKLVSIVGRLRYRTSYGQNVLNHSIEVAYLCAMIAEEIGGVDPIIAKKAGFFHDIGKAVDQETQGSHTEIGYTILKKFNQHELVQDAALHHHDDKPETIITQIVKAADAISASRVGARRDTYEKYVARLEELERTASDFPGVDKVYAIQAGREVRIFINPHEIDDYQAYTLAKDIARRVENELQYPGEIRVTVIRETRAIEYAR